MDYLKLSHQGNFNLIGNMANQIVSLLLNFCLPVNIFTSATPIHIISTEDIVYQDSR